MCACCPHVRHVTSKLWGGCRSSSAQLGKKGRAPALWDVWEEEADNLEGRLALSPATKQCCHIWAVVIRAPALRIRTADGKMCAVLCLEGTLHVKVLMYRPHPPLKCVAGVVNMQKCSGWGRVQALYGKRRFLTINTFCVGVW